MLPEFATKKLKKVTTSTLERMIEQVLHEIDNNAENYTIFAKRWKGELKPLLEMKQYLEKRKQQKKVEQLDEEINGNKEAKNTNSKAPAKNTKKTGRKTV